MTTGRIHHRALLGVSMTTVIFRALLWALVIGWARASHGSDQTRGAYPDTTDGSRQPDRTNVCAVEEVAAFGRRYFSDSLLASDRRVCGHRTLLRYFCCSGFESEDGLDGCQKVLPLASLPETMVRLQLHKMAAYSSQDPDVSAVMTSSGPYTVFAPEDAAFYRKNHNSSWVNHPDPTDSPLPYHVVRGRLYLSDLRRNRTLHAGLGQQTAPLVVRNYGASGVVTVNCARVILPDHSATNGLVHIIDKVLEPIERASASLMELLLFDSALSHFASLLVRSELGDVLRSSIGSYTVFAPSDRAFEKAPRALSQRLMHDPKLLHKFLRYHIVDQYLCSAAILGPAAVTSLEGQEVRVDCDVTDSVTVNGAPISKRDSVALNGVVHVIDELLVPDSVQTLSEKARELGLSWFVHYADRVGMISDLMRQTATNYTVMAPSQHAFANLTTDQKRRLQAPGVLDWLTSYHVTERHVTTRDMIGDGRLPTYRRDVTATSPAPYVITKTYTNSFGVNNALVTNGDLVVSNGVLHVIDHVMWPPTSSLMDKIKGDTELRTFWSLLRISGLDVTLLGNSTRCLTIFAPTDAALEAMDTGRLDLIMEDNNRLIQFLQHHIIPSPVYLRTLHPHWTYSLKTLLGAWIHVRRSPPDSARFLVNDLTPVVAQGDVMATNGVLHKTDAVIPCEAAPCGTPLPAG